VIPRRATIQRQISRSRILRVNDDPLTVGKRDIFGLLALILFYAIGYEIYGAQDYGTFNQLGPLALIVIMISGAARMVRANPMALWLALFWFRISTALYFGLGSLVPGFANVHTRLYLDAFFPLDQELLFKLNLIVSLCVLTVLATSAFYARYSRFKAGNQQSAIDDQKLWVAGVVFAISGFSVKYLVLIPFSLGAYGNITLPGLLLSLGLLSHVGLYLLTLYVVRRRPAMFPLIIVLFVIELGAGTVQLNKTEPLLTTLMFTLALLTNSPKPTRAVLSIALIVTVFSTLVPLVGYGRDEMMQRYGTLSSGTLGERMEVLWDYTSQKSAIASQQDVNGVLVRISYANAAAFAISDYDNGEPGPSLELALAAIVPRVLWPEKPNMTNIGSVFNERATGYATSSSSPGLFAEAYWSMGWLGVPVLMVPFGLVLTAISRYAQWIMATGNWWYFPLAMLALRMGLRVDGWYVPDVIGPTATLVVLTCLARFAGHWLGVLAVSRRQSRLPFE